MNKAKTVLLEFMAKRDFSFEFYDASDCLLARGEFIPDFLEGGDNVLIKIDLATGQVVGWNPPSNESIEALMEGLHE